MRREAGARTLAPHGTAWSAGPGRRTADEAILRTEAVGLSADLVARFSLEDAEHLRRLPEDGPEEPPDPAMRGRIYRLRLR